MGDIQEKQIAWLDKLNQSQFAGEVFLSADELGEIASIININRPSPEMKDLILICAVNCAYHYYDDHGFWKHFMELINQPNTQVNKQNIGRLIERQLEERGLAKRNRTGPFRYVGAILEQCAVSRKHIASFATIVKELKAHYGWEGLSSLEYDQYLTHISSVLCSKYLKNYLVDPDGWDFVKQVSRLCQLLENGVIKRDELEKLSGYQPHFWSELLTVINQETLTADPDSHVKRKKPYLMFNPDKLTIGLSINVDTIVEYPTVKGWANPITWLRHPSLFSSTYYGHFSVEGEIRTEWSLKGWMPDGSPALFNINWSFVHPNNVIVPGTYYLLTCNASDLKNISWEELGPVDLASDTVYRAYLVTLGENAHVTGYSMAYGNYRFISLAWQEPELYRLPYTANPCPVFNGILPPIDVSDFGLVAEDRVGLFYDIGEGPRMLRNQQQVTAFYTKVEQQAPVQGRIWLEAISRNRYIPPDAVLPELHFILLPSCHITVEPNPVPYGQNPVITVDAGPSLNVAVNEGITVGDGRHKWEIRGYKDNITGVLSLGDIRVYLEWPLYRTFIYDCNGLFVSSLCDENLQQEDYLATGVPLKHLSLGLWMTEYNKDIGHFDEKGRCTIPARTIKEIVPGNQSVGELTLIVDGVPYRTGAIYYDMDRIISMTVDGEWELEYPFEPPLVVLLKQCATLCRFPHDEVTINRVPEGPDCIMQWIYSVFACSFIFDSTRFYMGGDQVTPLEKLPESELKECLLFYERLGQGEQPLYTNYNSEAIPAVDRWLNKFNERTMWTTVGGREQLLRKWTEEVTTTRSRFRSPISKLDGGQLLSKAWRHYLTGNPEMAMATINAIHSTIPIINELARILSVMVLLRQARFTHAATLAERVSVFDELESIRHVLHLVARYREGINSFCMTKRVLPDLSILPLTERDCRLLENIVLSFHDFQAAKRHATTGTDWLLVWTLLRLSKHNDGRIALSESLTGMQSSIPESPERREILSYMSETSREV